jgi:hypothetical protein
LEDYVAVDDVDTLHIKKINYSGSYKYRYREDQTCWVCTQVPHAVYYDTVPSSGKRMRNQLLHTRYSLTTPD